MSRRAFLALGAGAAAVVTGAAVLRVRPAGDRSCEGAEGIHALRCRLSRFLSDPRGAAALGAAIIPSLGLAPDAIPAAIAPDTVSDPEAWFAGVGRDGFRRHVRDRSRAEFALGDVVVVDGWRLSRTEAHICALWHLVS